MEKYYVSGCRDDGEATVTCDDSEATFWTLYTRDDKGLSQGIIDLAFREDAEAAMVVYVEREALQEQVQKLEMFKEAFDQWHDKTEWVQTDKRFDVLLPWGKHRADVLKDYIDMLEEQVQTLAAEADYLRDEIKQHSESVHLCEVCGKDDPCKNDDVCYALSHPLPATVAVIREIGAKAVEGFSNTLWGDFSLVELTQKYAAKLRAGEQL